jgi:hypothetical protein
MSEVNTSFAIATFHKVEIAIISSKKIKLKNIKTPELSRENPFYRYHPSAIYGKPG